MIFMLYTGARTGEALWLDWRDVDLARAHVSFRRPRTARLAVCLYIPRDCALSPTCSTGTGEVFRRPDGKPYARPRSADDTSAGTRIKTGFKAACRRAGIEIFPRTTAGTRGRRGTTRRTAISAR